MIRSAKCIGCEFSNIGAGVYCDCNLIGRKSSYFPRKSKIDDSKEYIHSPINLAKYQIKKENQDE